MDSIYLKKHKESDIQKGYPWIFRDDISSLPLLESSIAGTLFKVCDHKGRYIATAYGDPLSKIVARVISDYPKHLDEDFFLQKLSVAMTRREDISGKFYRLCNAEGDYLPGLTIDRFDNIYSIKFGNEGIYSFEKEIIAAIIKLFSPLGILIRYQESKKIIGTVPEEIVVQENGVSYLCNLLEGQKTGWYFDQRENHKLIAGLAQEKTLLDVYCYNGGFGVAAAKAGASNVVFVDSSELAIEYVKRNIELNDGNSICEFYREDAFDFLERINQQFDIVVLDPPPFIKARKDKAAGLKGYKKLVELSLPLINKDGYLFFATCSHHMYMNDLIDLVNEVSKSKGIIINIIKKTGAASDHPVHNLVPQTRYLNAILARIG